MIIAINYADKPFKKAQKLNSNTAKRKAKVDKVIEYDPNKLDKEFKIKNNIILNESRGGGYWLWKPYIINDCLKNKSMENDYIIYSDSGECYLRDVNQLIKVMNDNDLDIMAFGVKYREIEWTKRDILKTLDCDKAEYYLSNQFMGSPIIIKNTKYANEFVDEWLLLAQDKQLITDEPSKNENYKEFKENRHDQSIFSCLCKKWNVPMFRDPSQYGKYRTKYYSPEVISRSKYPVIFDLHHQKNSASLFEVRLKRIIRYFKNIVINKKLKSYKAQYY